MNSGARRESGSNSNRSRSASSRDAYSSRTSYRASSQTNSRTSQGRSYSSRYGEPSRDAYGARTSYRASYPDRSYSSRYDSADSRYRAGTREQRPASRASNGQRTERRSYPNPQTGRAARPSAPQSRHRAHGSSQLADTLTHYLRMANSDVLGRRRWKLLPAVYLPLACFYSEILLGLFGGVGLSGLIYKLFFSLATGLLLGGFALLFKPSIQRIVVRIELFVIALLFTVQCLIRKEFQMYFSLGTIVGNTANVMGKYGGDLMHSILTGIPIIIAFMLPPAFYWLKTRKRLRRSFATSFKRIFAVELIALSLVMWSLGMLCLAIGGDSDSYKTGFELTSSSDTLGLLTGFRLNEKYAMSDNDAADAFGDLDEMTAMPASAPVPAQSEAPEASAAPDEAEAAVAVATAAPTATPAPLGDNSLNIDFAALNANESNEDIATINTYLSRLSASNQNEYTGLFKGKNLIMICAEAFSDAVIDPQLTPTLYRLTHNGFYFSEAYQPSWGGSTSTGEFSMLLGLVPSNSDVMADTVGKNNYFTMASQLKRIGYSTWCYHNGSYTYYDRNITHLNLGFDQFMAHGNGLEELAGKYPSDEEMMNVTLDLYIDQQPFCVYYMTCDGHKPYNDAKDARVTEHLSQVLSVYPDRYQQNTLNYICYQLELEDALTSLVARLEAEGLADDTVICICSDHYPYGLDRDGAKYVRDLYGYDPQHPWEQERNSIIIWSGCLENENRDMACEIDTPVYSLDILPTLSNLFGTEYDSRLLVGRDVFSDETPLVLWRDGSWVTNCGRYDADEKRFYPTIDIGNEADYVQSINSIVKYKKAYSKLVVNTDYYQYLLEHALQGSDAGANA